MKLFASLGLAACLLASPAVAGPAGVGLTFTEEVMKKNLRKRAAEAQAQAEVRPTADARPKTAADCAAPREAGTSAPSPCRAL